MPRVKIKLDEDTLGKLGDAIRVCRQERGLSQEALADAANLNRTHMGEVERGKRNVSFLAVKRIADGLGLPVSTILANAGL